ncbi:polyprenyl synthetase family protein [Brevibacillus humidisoli]|uniref:polyprenyl synthetase family protein n=1 Tax=Brevibacillus humidisoli TaxID=2895522 RepID=UPI001E2E6D4B|nr:farnesyl diphosphate synthase [Brevibacillus humidisoli]UFJ42906.1 polyprenyl synthetase family protein [Brevibacillus humidisoli]
MNQTLSAYLQERAALIERNLLSALEREEVPARLYESMSYSLMAGGKRLRPVLVLAVLESLGAPIERGIPYAVSLELIHTYSLIHDDLPAMDDDDLRRGKPTNHKVYGEATAILAGDALLTRAFSSIADAYLEHPEVKPENGLRLIAELGRRCGAAGMVGGQMADMEGEGRPLSLAELEYIHCHKTGDLLVAALRGAAYLADASPTLIDALTRYGMAIGLAFQIQDDILDVEGDTAQLGKTAGSDQSRQKVTYPSLIGMEASKQKLAQLVSDAKEALRAVGLGDSILVPLADYIMERSC